MVYQQTFKVAQKLAKKEKSIRWAALKLFDEKGYECSSIKEITRLAGVAAGTFYLYFRNKEQLFTSLIDEFYQQMIEDMRCRRKTMEADAQKKLSFSMQYFLKLFSEHRKLARLVLLQSRQDKVHRLVAAIHDELTGFIREDLEEAMDQGLIPAQDCRLTAQAIAGSYNQVILNWLSSEVTSPVEEVTGSLLSFALRGAGFKILEEKSEEGCRF
ncbi:MAG TPA: TetR/AcrR family transcriptional regulator [Desulfotomaculum sp.]|nr:TetR/AcrR family transcriptional regulator [Desulfotomaculum sp.]